MGGQKCKVRCLQNRLPLKALGKNLSQPLSWLRQPLTYNSHCPSKHVCLCVQISLWADTVTHAYKSQHFGRLRQDCLSPEVQDQPVEHSEILCLHKIQKISWAWWNTPVVTATQEAEVKGSLEPRRLRLQWAMIVPVHCSVSDRARPCLKNKSKT